MRLKLWIGSGVLVLGVAAGTFLLNQPEAQAVDESQAAAIACQKDLDAWDGIVKGARSPDRLEVASALDAAVRCGHSVSAEDRELVGEG